MSDNLYAPPASSLTGIRPADIASSTPPLFAVSLVKLVVLSICTLGFYEIYWFYRNWHLFKARSEPKILPVWRALFGVLFCYPCFRRIRDTGLEHGITPVPAAGALAAGWILVSITWKLPDPYWLVSMFAVVFLVPIQAYANRVNAAVAPDHDPNSRFSAWNWVTCVFGGLLLALAIVGTFMPE